MPLPLITFVFLAWSVNTTPLDAGPRAARAVLSRGGYQQGLPADPARPTRGDGRGDARSSPVTPPAASRQSFPAPLLWVLALGGGLGLLLWIAGETRHVSRPSLSSAHATSSVEAPALTRTPAQPETLAAEGRYAEALRALLRQAFVELSPRPTPPLTAREALRDARLADDARADLAALVDLVEHALFAHQRVERSDFLHGLDLHRRLQASRPPAGPA